MGIFNSALSYEQPVIKYYSVSFTKNHLNHSLGNRTTLVAVYVFDSLKVSVVLLWLL